MDRETYRPTVTGCSEVRAGSASNGQESNSKRGSDYCVQRSTWSREANRSRELISTVTPCLPPSHLPPGYSRRTQRRMLPRCCRLTQETIRGADMQKTVYTIKPKSHQQADLRPQRPTHLSCYFPHPSETFMPILSL